jgi:hypothetical protein
MTSRARGKHTQRPIEPNTPAGDGIGMSDRQQGTPSPIPGGRVHISNAQTVRQRVAVPESPAEIKDLNAHGVEPGTHTSRDRADAMRGPNTPKQPHIPEYTAPPVSPVPVPVRIVQDETPKVLRTSSPRHITVPASTGDPVRICGQSFNRVRIMLLNESSSSNIRLAQRLSDLTNGGGALLPWPTNSYVTFHTQDELWALSADSGAPVLSIIEEFEQPW